MADDEDSVELSEYCFSLCEALKTAIQGKNADDLNESVRMALEDSERCVDWPRSNSCLYPYQTTSGLRAKSNGLSGRGRTHQISNATRARITSWRSKRYSSLSRHRAQTRVNVPPA
jgi:hypothetical protein